MNAAWRRLVAPAVTVALLALLVRQLARQGGAFDPADFVARLSPGWIAFGVACFLAVNVLRAVRFSVLIPGPSTGPAAFMPIGFALSFLNNILPLRGGEVAFVVGMRSGYGVPAAHSAAGLLLARMLDYLAVATWFVPLALAARDRLPPTSDWPVPGLPTAGLIGGAVVFIAAFGVGVASLSGVGQRLLGAAARWVDRLGWGGRPAVMRGLAFGARGVAAFDALRARRTYLAAFGLTLALWLGIFAWQYSFARGLALPSDPGAPTFATLGFGLFVVGATFGSLSKAIPVPTLGGHGVTEVGWTLGFTLVGLPVGTAIASSLGITLLTLVVSTVFGVPALAWMTRRRNGRAGPATPPPSGATHPPPDGSTAPPA